MEAARKGSEEIAELLIKKGAQLDMVMEVIHSGVSACMPGMKIAAGHRQKSAHEA